MKRTLLSVGVITAMLAGQFGSAIFAQQTTQAGLSTSSIVYGSNGVITGQPLSTTYPVTSVQQFAKPSEVTGARGNQMYPQAVVSYSSPQAIPGNYGVPTASTYPAPVQYATSSTFSSPVYSGVAYPLGTANSVGVSYPMDVTNSMDVTSPIDRIDPMGVSNVVSYSEVVPANSAYPTVSQAGAMPMVPADAGNTLMGGTSAAPVQTFTSSPNVNSIAPVSQPKSYGGASSSPSSGLAQQKAARAAQMGYRGHLGGGLGGANYEGVGWSNQSAQRAIESCCYWGDRSPAGIGCSRGADGFWYACVLYH